MRIACASVLAATLLFAPLSGVAHSHSMAPALLEVEELDGGRVAVTWKLPMLQLAGVTLSPAFPADCVTETEPVETQGEESITSRWTLRCGPRGLVDSEVGVDGLVTGKTDALVRVRLADGRLVQGVLRASEPRIMIPARPKRLDVLMSYGKLGTEHILTGPDHLLFVLGLLMLVGSTGLLVRTITAFTVGHSITLSLAVLGLVTIPPRPIEIGIAASVFLLAVELTRESQSATLLRRAPWAMAGAFGLLHGLGFAGALAEVGLPAGEIPLALFSFNVGIEIGQLTFVAAMLGAAWAFGRVVASRPAWITLGPAYVMGSLSAFWCVERTAALLLGR